MTSTPTLALAGREAIEAGGMVVQVTEPREDGFGRVVFFAYWHQDKEWANGSASHVSGQVFHSRLDEFTARAARRGRRVVVLGSGEKLDDETPCRICPARSAQ